jgi:hypothetical protein
MPKISVVKNIDRDPKDHWEQQGITKINFLKKGGC